MDKSDEEFVIFMSGIALFALTPTILWLCLVGILTGHYIGALPLATLCVAALTVEKWLRRG